jgi:hypothetical protein
MLDLPDNLHTLSTASRESDVNELGRDGMSVYEADASTRDVTGHGAEGWPDGTEIFVDRLNGNGNRDHLARLGPPVRAVIGLVTVHQSADVCDNGFRRLLQAFNHVLGHFSSAQKDSHWQLGSDYAGPKMERLNLVAGCGKNKRDAKW